MKIIIPMAGFGKRLGQLTHHKPKALVRIAQKRLIDHVLDTFHQVEQAFRVEYIFIVGYLGEQIREHMTRMHPEKKVIYYVQEQLMGQSHAVFLARHTISGPVLLTFCDTINEIDYSALSFEKNDGLAAVHEVEDPRRHGVAIVGADGLVTRLVEKPETLENKLALTGVYYFCEGRDLIAAIETQMERGTTVGKEYYLADAVNILLERGLRIGVERVRRWLDAGTPEAVIQTNAALLDSSGASAETASNLLIRPFYIHPSAHVDNSVIGPNAAIGENCSVSGCILQNTIIDDGSRVTGVILQNSLIGRDCLVNGQPVSTVVADYAQRDILSTEGKMISSRDADGLNQEV